MKISRNHHALKQIKINIPSKITRYSKNNATIIRQKFNKPDLRAKGLSLLSLALRPGLLEKEEGSNKKTDFHLIAPLAIFGLICGLNFIIGSSTTSAASLTLTVPDSPLSLELGPDGKFKATKPAEVSVKTDSLSGYKLTINSKSGDNKLKGSSHELVSIPEKITGQEFSDNAKYINNWGYKPSKINGENNEFYIPGPTASLSVINTTKGRNVEADKYTFAIAAKADASTPEGNYSDIFTLCVATNGNDYRIEYKSDESDGSVLPEAQEGIAEGNSVKLSDVTPTKSTDDVDYEFKGWCTEKPDGNNTDNPTCSGGIYQPGSNFALCDGGSPVTLYAMWKESGITDANCPGVKIEECELNGIKGERYNDGLCWMTNNYKSSVLSSGANCPSGWSLPSKSQFKALISSYQVGNATCLYSRGWRGRYWTSTHYDSSYYYNLQVTGSDAKLSDAALSDLKNVRCVSN